MCPSIWHAGLWGCGPLLGVWVSGGMDLGIVAHGAEGLLPLVGVQGHGSCTDGWLWLSSPTVSSGDATLGPLEWHQSLLHLSSLVKERNLVPNHRHEKASALPSPSPAWKGAMRGHLQQSYTLCRPGAPDPRAQSGIGCGKLGTEARVPAEPIV